jgi:hypothetical protein
MADIFISHSSADNAFTRELTDQMIEAGLDLWVDFNGIQSGDEWLQQIQVNLDVAKMVVIVMSDNAQKSKWVEREALRAMEQKKPIHIALIEKMPLPLHLVDRQYIDFTEKPEAAARKLMAAVRRTLNANRTPRKKGLSPTPDRNNFFKYLKQLPAGDANAAIARDLYQWGKSNGDEIEFGGKYTPGLHVKLQLGDDEVTLFSIWAYRNQPKVQVHFAWLRDHSPYDDDTMRQSTMLSLNRLMGDKPFIEEQADRRPTLPLIPALDTESERDFFKQVIAEIIDNLQSSLE